MSNTTTTTNLNTSNHSNASGGSDKKKKKEAKPQASISETLSFATSCGPKTVWLGVFGAIGGLLNGLVYPMLAYLFSTSFSDISAASSNGLGAVRELAMTFMVVGTYALFAATMQSCCFELMAFHATQNLRLQWFRALLRQDAAYFDVNNVSGIAGQVGPACNKYHRGMGRKFGEGVQFFVTGVGGIVYAFYASWRVAFVVIGALPIVSFSALMLLKINQTKGSRAVAAYKVAGSVVYSAVSAIKTVLSLNGVQPMIDRYTEATQLAYNQSVRLVIQEGFWNGSMLGSFLALYCVMTLFGSFLLYRDIEDTGCDPSDGVVGNETCKSSGPDVFGAMLGIAFAAQGLSQFGNYSQAFSQARVSAYEALQAINRTPGAPEEVIYRKPNDSDIGSTKHSKKSTNNVSTDLEGSEEVVQAILPKYEIDSTSNLGLKPDKVQGNIEFKDVFFSYPTRPSERVLQGVSTLIEPGQTVAFVGPSGSGKSTVVGLLERFYDPQSGTIELDGTNLKDLNVAHLRGMIGYVGQEPTLFATTIRANIQYGNPKATPEEVEQAAKLANAHDFITAFSAGYETQVGDKGSQLSGGQKQRIAIARILVANPKMLILDESTSALDSESEIIVQETLDNIVQQKKISTVIIAHRLSTIRHCDIINVLSKGVIVESGTHEVLMDKKGYYHKLVEKQEGAQSASVSRDNSAADLKALENSDITTSSASKTVESTTLLAFRNVSFAYPSRPRKIVMNDFNLEVTRGSTLALVGPSGGGKSTTVGLIERFYDPNSGTIEYLGKDVKTLNVHSYRSQIGYVGQEPVLFNDTIANNIAFGAPGATRSDIEAACKQANAHDFIMEFDENYETAVGERGTQLSGGQKQRVAIARALVQKPQLLLFDEATSALDNDSEAIVQGSIDELMESKDHTCIVIAHRLSTIQNADKIALVAEGKVLELGSHEELISKPDGRYKRLFDSSRRDTTITAEKLTGLEKGRTIDKDEEVDWEKEAEEETKAAFDGKRARAMASPDKFYFLIGSIGAVMAGAVFPLWGIIFSETIDILFRRVYACPDADGMVPEVVIDEGFSTCESYRVGVADELRDGSYVVSSYWVAVMVGCIAGNMLTFYGFGTASERLNKRVRDSSFRSLLRQEVAFFDKRSVGSITSQLQDDAGRIQAFSGEPVRAFLVAASSVIIGVTLSFFFMWPFALLAIGCVPLMGFATSIEMKQMLGEDESSDTESPEGKGSAGGVIVETLLNMRTVSALTLEEQRYKDYEKTLEQSKSNVFVESFISGLTSGLSQFIQQWINALQLWFGGYILFTFPEEYGFKDFLISNFAVLFALFGLGAAFQDISDRKEVEKSIGRIFYLLDRKSEIDPLSEDGKKVDEEFKGTSVTL